MSSEDLVESPAWVLTAEQQESQVAKTECEAACEAGDIQRVKEIFQMGLLGQIDLTSMMTWTVSEGWLEPTRCLLELGADPNKISVISLAEHCPSLDMFKLLAAFGMSYSTSQRNVLEQVPNSHKWAAALRCIC